MPAASGARLEAAPSPPPGGPGGSRTAVAPTTAPSARPPLRPLARSGPGRAAWLRRSCSVPATDGWRRGPSARHRSRPSAAALTQHWSLRPPGDSSGGRRALRGPKRAALGGQVRPRRARQEKTVRPDQPDRPDRSETGPHSALGKWPASNESRTAVAPATVQWYARPARVGREYAPARAQPRAQGRIPHQPRPLRAARRRLGRSWSWWRGSRGARRAVGLSQALGRASTATRTLQAEITRALLRRGRREGGQTEVLRNVSRARGTRLFVVTASEVAGQGASALPAGAGRQFDPLQMGQLSTTQLPRGRVLRRPTGRPAPT